MLAYAETRRRSQEAGNVTVQVGPLHSTTAAGEMLVDSVRCFTVHTAVEHHAGSDPPCSDPEGSC